MGNQIQQGKYVFPSLTDEVPQLKLYCSKDPEDYHCRNLRDLLFCKVNKLKCKDLHDDEWSTKYHIQQLMDRNHPAFVNDTKEQMLNSYQKYENMDKETFESQKITYSEYLKQNKTENACDIIILCMQNKE